MTEATENIVINVIFYASMICLASIFMLLIIGNVIVVIETIKRNKIIKKNRKEILKLKRRGGSNYAPESFMSDELLEENHKKLLNEYRKGK
jgi:hypothetical protein